MRKWGKTAKKNESSEWINFPPHMRGISGLDTHIELAVAMDSSFVYIRICSFFSSVVGWISKCKLLPDWNIITRAHYTRLCIRGWLECMERNVSIEPLNEWNRMALVAIFSMAPASSLRWKFRLDETNVFVVERFRSGGHFLSNLCEIFLFACVYVSPRTGWNSYRPSRFSHLSIIIITATRLCEHSKAIIEMRYRWQNEPQGDSGGWLRTSGTTTIDFDLILSWNRSRRHLPFPAREKTDDEN